MPLAVDLIGSGMPVEQAIREGDTTLYVVASTGTTIGGPNGATIIECAASGGGKLTFLATTELDRQYTIYNPGTALSIIVPVSAGTGITSLFQTGSSSFSLTSTKTATVTRIGIIGTVNTTTDRWIYTLSA